MTVEFINFFIVISDPDFGSHFLTNPRVYHAVHKREISSSREAEVI